MPHLRIETNIPKSKIPVDFVTKIVPALAKTLGKPVQQQWSEVRMLYVISKLVPKQAKPAHYNIVSVIPELPMSFGGTTDPCAIANLMSIGALGVEENKKHAKVLYQIVEEELGVPKDRMYIGFQNEQSSNVGYNGTTFHDIFG